MNVACPECSAQFDIAESAASQVRCPRCGHTFAVSDAGEAEPSEIAALKGVMLLGSASAKAGQAKANRYYIRRKTGKVFGPFQKDLIRQMIVAGKLVGDEGISLDKTVWIPILSVAEFSDIFSRAAGRQGGDSAAPGDTMADDLRPRLAPSIKPSAGRPGPAGFADPDPASASVHDEPTKAFDDGDLPLEELLRAAEGLEPSGSELGYDPDTEFSFNSDDFRAIAGSAGDTEQWGATIPDLPPIPGAPVGPSESPSTSLGRPPGGLDLREVDRDGEELAELPKPKRLPGGPEVELPELPLPKRPSPLERPSPRGRIEDLPAPKGRMPVLPDAPGSRHGDTLGAIPELPVPKERGYGQGPELPVPKERGYGRGPELPVPKEHSYGRGPELPLPKERDYGQGPELPVSKEPSYGPPELPVPKERDDGLGPELPVSRQSVPPQLPTPKEAAFPRPELPVPKGSGTELPVPKGSGTELPVPKGSGTELPVPKAHMEELPELPLLRGVRELPTPKTSTSRSAAPGRELAEPSLSLPELPAPRLGHADLPVLRHVDDALEDEGLGRDTWDSLLDADQDAFKPDLPARVYGDGAQLPGSSEDGTTGPGLPVVEDLSSASAQDLLDEALGETDDLLGDLSLPLSSDAGALDIDLDLDSASLPAVERPDDTDLTDSLFESIGPPGEAIAIPTPPSREPESAAPPAPEETEDVWSRRRRERRERREQRHREAEARAPAARQRPARRASARTFSGSRILIALLALLAVVVLVLQFTGFFDLPNPDEYAGPMGAATPHRRPPPEEQTPVDVTRAVELSFDTLRAGDFGSYLTFIQQASNAAAATEYRDQNAVARLLVGQALMAIQYGEQARMVEGMAGRVGALTDADSPLQALAKGAVAAFQGDVETARALLSDVTEAQYAAWASLFEGLAAFQRYQLDAEAFERARLGPIEDESLEPTPEGGEPPEGGESGSDASAEGGEGEDLELQDEPRPARPVLDEAAAEAFELAARRDPQLVVAPYFLGRFYLLSGDAEAAVRAFSQALEASPVHVPSQIGLSRALVELGQFEEASRRLAQALEPDNTASTEHERAHLYALRGRVAMVRQRYDEALTAFQRAYVEDPSNTEVIWTLTDLFERSGAFDEGVRFFEQNSAPEAESAEISLALAALKLGLAQGQDEEAKAVTLDEVYQSLEGGRGAHPDDGRFAYYLARVREAQNRFEESRLLFEEAVEVDPDNPLPHLGLTELARLSNQSEQAVAHLQQAMEAAAGDARVLTRIGQQMEALERPDLAADAFRRAVEADAALVEAHYAIVRLLLSRSGSRHAFEQALSELELVEDFGVDDAELHSLFAEVHYRLGHLNTARERMERAAERQDTAPPPDQSFLMGRINFDAGQAEVENDPSRAREFFLAAREDFQRAYMGGTDSAAPYFWEGRAYFELGEYELALTGFRGAIDGLDRGDEGNGEYHYWQGRALEALGQNAQALESYLTVDLYDLQWALDHPDVYFRRGRLLLHQARRLRAAKRDLRWALVLDPQNAAAAAELGEIHYRRERFQRAIELWNRSLRIDPSQAEIHYRLGSTYYNRLDDPELAIRHLEQAIEMGYGNREPEIYQMLGYLYRDAPGRSHDGQAITMFRRYLESGAADQNRDLRIEVENQIRRLGGRI